MTLCGCQAVWVDVQGRIIGQLFNGLPDMLLHGWKVLLSDCYVVPSCAMVRRDDLGTRPFDTALRVGEDRDLWIKLASNGTVALVQDVMVRIRLPCMSHGRALMLADTWPMLQRHLAAFADSLSWRDRARAYGSLNSQVGKILCRTPHNYACGMLYLAKAVLLGFRPADSLRELIRTAPPVRALRRIRNHRRPEDRPADSL